MANRIKRLLCSFYFTLPQVLDESIALVFLPLGRVPARVEGGG